LIIGIDSLDPYILLQNKNVLPNFSHLIDNSPTLLSKSCFPVDSIPAWASIYTGLNPSNHNLMYSYDVFDPELSGLAKINAASLKGKTFWDYSSECGLRTILLYPLLIFPSYKFNGIMINKSIYDKRIDPIKTEIEIDAYPECIKKEYDIANKFPSVWGGFPGESRINEWVALAKSALEGEASLGLNLYKLEECDIFFIYFSILDIIQHRLWRFFDQNDPQYCRKKIGASIMDFYKTFDDILGEFLKANPKAGIIIISDHGHKSRPIKTININYFLSKKGFLVSKGTKKKAQGIIRKAILETANRFDFEPLMVRLVAANGTIAKISKSMYSSAGSIDRSRSSAYLSDFAGIKSYSYGGIQINNESLSKDEYEHLREALIESISEIKAHNGQNIIQWIGKREIMFPGKFTEKVYPDIVFELRDDYGTGWDLNSGLYGKAFDHKVSSGGHGKNATFIMNNICEKTIKKEITLADIAPTILDIMQIKWQDYSFDGTSILGE